MTEPEAGPYRLSVLGGRELVRPDGGRVMSVLAQPKRLCLLTYLALAPDPVSRSSLAALFWPQSDEARARNALSQAVFYLRRSTSKDVVESREGELLWVRPDAVWCDARRILPGEATVAELEHASARDLIEGWNADDSQPLQEWLDATRRRIRARAVERLEAMPPPSTNGQESAPTEVSRAVSTPQSDPPTRLAETPSSDAARSDRARLWVAVAVLTVAVLGLLVRDGGPAPTPADVFAAPERPTLLVLRPIWTSSSKAPDGLEQAIMAQVLATLEGVDELRVQDATFLTERADIELVLQAIGQQERPEMFAQIVLTLSGSELRAQTNLWGELGVSLGSDRLQIDFADETRLVWEAPDSIAATVLDTVERELESGLGAR